MFVSDTSVERNTLMEQVYPKLKSFCQERGYDFQVVDMRWGIREEATDDHMMTELCMRELQTCQKLSTGPNFVVSFPLSNSLNYDLEPFGTQSGEFLLTRGPARLSLRSLVFWRTRDPLYPAKVQHPGFNFREGYKFNTICDIRNNSCFVFSCKTS